MAEQPPGTQLDDKPFAVVPATFGQLAGALAIGIGVGLAAWGLSFFFERYIFQALLCHGSQAIRCDMGAAYAEGVAHVLAAGVGLFFLVRLRVFRPLLVALAAMACLWGIVGLTVEMPTYAIGLSVAGLYGAAYLTFAWVARLRMFWLVVVLLVAMVVGVRYVLVA